MAEVGPLEGRKDFEKAKWWFFFNLFWPIAAAFIAAFGFGQEQSFLFRITFSVLFVVFYYKLYFPWRCQSLKLRFVYPACGKYIPSDTKWRCGRCDAENKDTLYHSFLNRCEHCTIPPKAYVCHHCGVILYLDEDKDDRHPATAVLPPVVDETIERARIRRAEQIAEKRDLITLADLEARLKEAQARANPLPEKPKKTKKEIYEEKFQEKYRGAFFAVDDICKHAIENARRDYPNNPVKLAQELAVVKMFRRDHLGDEGEQTE